MRVAQAAQRILTRSLNRFGRKVELCDHLRDLSVQSRGRVAKSNVPERLLLDRRRLPYIERHGAASACWASLVRRDEDDTRHLLDETCRGRDQVRLGSILVVLEEQGAPGERAFAFDQPRY